MNSDILFSEDQSETPNSVLSKSSQKIYLNRKEKLEQKHESELIRCRSFFEEFIEKFKSPNSNKFGFNKVLEIVKVPFNSLPSMCQIKAFYMNYLSRETRRKYMKKGLWNEKELKLLLWSVVFYSEHISQKIDEFSDADWHEISQLFPHTPALKCKAKWFSIKKSKFMRAKWTPEEDSQLLSMMKTSKKGKISWNDIATTINNSIYKGEFMRTGRHCRDRWVHHLNPKLSRIQWSSDEDLQIVRYVMENGKKWANLAKNMDNRNEDSIRNRFIKLMKSCRNKERIGKNMKECKAEGNMLTKLLNELNKKSMNEEEEKSEDQNNEAIPNNLGSKRKREKSQIIKEEAHNNVKMETEEKKQENILSNPTKIEENPTKINETINNQRNLYELWDQFAMQNQWMFQEMMMQRMRLMANNFLWNPNLQNSLLGGAKTLNNK